MCDCIEKVEASTVKAIDAKLGDSGSHLDGVIEGMTWLMDASVRMCTDYKYQYEKKFKNGNVKVCKETLKLIFNYCPFCGVKYNTEP